MDRILRFFSHPAIGILGSIASIIGFGTGFYFYYASQAKRELTCAVTTPATQIVKAGQATGLSVSYNGQAVTTDVSASQIVLWNAGKLPIKKDDILDPVVITTEKAAPILEATLRTKSRAVTEAAMDTSEISKGRLKLTWKILEQQDGVRLQIIYAGGPATKLGVVGAIEGQPHVLMQGTSSGKPRAGFIAMMIICALGGLVVGTWTDSWQGASRFGVILRIAFAVATITAFGLAVSELIDIVASSPQPPAILFSSSGASADI